MIFKIIRDVVKKLLLAGMIMLDLGELFGESMMNILEYF